MSERPKLILHPRTAATAGVVNITPPIEEINNSLPSYYVRMGEGVMFQVESTSGLHTVLTEGLCGCVAIPILIKYNNNNYIFLNHIASDTDRDIGIDKIIKRIIETIRTFDDLSEFDFGNTDYDTTVGVVANGFGEKTTLAYAVLQKMITRLGRGRECFRIQGSSIAFAINREKGKGKIVIPTGVGRDESRLACYGTRQEGYGPFTECTEAPYGFD